jgi:hypothetical protein
MQAQSRFDHPGSDTAENLGYRTPIAPALAQAPVGGELIDDRSIGGLWIGKLPHQLGRDALAFLVLIGVVVVDFRQNLDCSIDSDVL